MEPKVECPDSDVNDTAFVQETSTIGGLDALEKFFACGIYPLASSFGFRDVALSTTALSNVEMSIPVFPVEAISMEDANHFLAKIEMNAEMVLGSYGPREHDACAMAKLPNGVRLNQIFEQMRVPYAPRPLPGTKAFQAVMEKQKVDVSKKTATKKVKVAQCKVAL
jgi:hypothetical protein